MSVVLFDCCSSKSANAHMKILDAPLQISALDDTVTNDEQSTVWLSNRKNYSVCVCLLLLLFLLLKKQQVE